MLTQRFRLFGLLMVFVLLGAACGGEAEPEGTAPAATDQTTTVVPLTTTSPGSTSVPLPTTAVPSPTTSATIDGLVDLFFSTGDGSDCSEVAAFQRAVSGSDDPVAAAFGELVGGPTTAEVAEGAGSFFSEETAGSVVSVSLEEDFLAVDFMDFREQLSNASTSCGSASLLASLNATAFQFDDVERVRYSIFGSCDVFYNWLQSECQDQTRAGSVTVDLDIYQQASGSGCTPGTEELPDGEWFGFAAAAGPDEVQFDLACWFSASAAADAAAEDGSESPPPNDYYVRNESDQLRDVPVAAGTEVAQLSPTGGPDSTIVDYGTWATGWSSRDYQPSMWITITGGEIVSIVEQYVP